MQKRPVVSGETLIKVLVSLDYEIVRQRGSHVRLKKPTVAGDHNITIPLHDELAKGTLNLYFVSGINLEWDFQGCLDRIDSAIKIDASSHPKLCELICYL